MLFFGNCVSFTAHISVCAWICDVSYTFHKPSQHRATWWCYKAVQKGSISKQCFSRFPKKIKQGPSWSVNSLVPSKTRSQWEFPGKPGRLHSWWALRTLLRGALDRKRESRERGGARSGENESECRCSPLLTRLEPRPQQRGPEALTLARFCGHWECEGQNRFGEEIMRSVLMCSIGDTVHSAEEHLEHRKWPEGDFWILLRRINHAKGSPQPHGSDRTSGGRTLGASSRPPMLIFASERGPSVNLFPNTSYRRTTPSLTIQT